MTFEVDFIPFATGGGANVYPPATYSGLPVVGTGVEPGLADPQLYNNTARLSSMMSAALANFISATLQINVLDDGNLTNLIANLTSAIQLGGAVTTGDWKFRPTGEVLSPVWVKANATTIGNASSGASQLANASAAALFAYLWANFSNTQCPVSGGRGANAAADFAANKTLQLPDARGLTMFGMDTMGGGATTFLSGVPATSGNATTPGSILGENLHALVTAELAAHSHGVTDPGHSHVGVLVPGTAVAGSAGAGVNGTTASAVTGISIQNAGSGTAHNTVPRVMLGTWYIKT